MSLDFILSSTSKVVADKNHLSSELDREMVILDKKSGVYFGLNHVGSSVWNLIQEPKTISEIRDAVAAKYQVAAEHCEGDILELLKEMADEELIEVNDETAE